tara:strand:+ start:924 stop:1352 length:429 start_codon:yes stop_codon:yes gene_type:complete
MSKKSRNKGLSYELELAKLFQLELGIERPQRILDQTREASLGDLLIGDVFLIEAKRYAGAAGGWYQPAWWKQCCSAAAKQNKIGVLVYRYDRMPNRFVFPIFSINTEWAVGDEFCWPTDGNAMLPIVCDQDTAMALMREWMF